MIWYFFLFFRDPFDAREDGLGDRHEGTKIPNIEVVVNVNDNAKQSSTNHQQQHSPMLSFASPQQLLNHSNKGNNEFRNLEPIQSPANYNNNNNNNNDNNSNDPRATKKHTRIACFWGTRVRWAPR